MANLKRFWIVLLIGLAIAGCIGEPVEETAAPEPATPAVPAPVGEAADSPEAAAPPVSALVQEVPEPALEEWYTPTIVAAPETESLDEEGAGRLLRVGGQLVCIMEGTPAEMGYQHGRLLAEYIQMAFKRGYVARAIFGRGYTREYVDTQTARMEKHFPPEYIEELHGVLAGIQAAGVEDVTYEELRLGLCVPELMHHPPDAPPGCSNFAVFGLWTLDGRLLAGGNLDWNIQGKAQDGAVLMVWRPAGGTPFVMLGWAGCIASLNGMNAHGLTYGHMVSNTYDETYDGMPVFVLTRRVLEQATNLDEAAAIIQAAPRTLGWNFVLGDGSVPDARAFEVDAVTCDVFAPLDPKESADTGHESIADAVRRTNHPCGENKLKKYAAAVAEKRGVEMPSWEAAKAMLREYLPEGNSWQRYTWLGEQIEAHPGAIDPERALQLLANGPVFCKATLHSFVFDPSQKVAYVSVAGVDPVMTATRMPYVRFDLSEWLQ